MSLALKEPRVFRGIQGSIQVLPHNTMSSFSCLWENRARAVSLAPKEDRLGEIRKEFPNHMTVRDNIILD